MTTAKQAFRAYTNSDHKSKPEIVIGLDKRLEIAKMVDRGITTAPENYVVRNFLMSFTTWRMFQKKAVQFMPELSGTSGKAIVKMLIDLVKTDELREAINKKYNEVR
jgi:hypothetical protein